MKLYHGSNVKIEQIDLSKSKTNKDFGCGFYLSADREQAEDMARFKTLTFGGEIHVTCMKGITFQYFFGTDKALKYLRTV